MDFTKLNDLYADYHESYRATEQKIIETWRSQGQTFREFWQTTIMNDRAGPLSKDEVAWVSPEEG